MAAVAEATEVVAEAAETVADGATAVADIARAYSGSNLAQAAVVGLGVGFVGGFIVGGLVISSRLRTQYEKFAEEEIDQMRDHFRNKEIARQEREQKPDLEGEAERITEREGYVPPAEEETVVASDTDDTMAVAPVPDPDVKNIFEDRQPPADDWDQEHEENMRDPEVPYVIHKDEFGALEESTETVLTYYVGDDVLADDKDKPIEDQDMVVGVANLDKFGHGSLDAEIVYVRNESLGLDIQVCRSDQTFAEAVHGLKHSEPTRRRRPEWDE